uniref:Uncharacterized protein n=1 Tax=Trypanosoma congolense (strain IL3000) TaxID=1068625 RepID=G0URI3_TRYCI|nr:conserved hypothetical protein [Trypanosoma congolense IL3000]
MTCGVILLLRDSCSALSTLQEVQRLISGGDDAARLYSWLADYVLYSLTPQVTFTLADDTASQLAASAESGRCRIVKYNGLCNVPMLRLLYVGATFTSVPCFVAIPSSTGRVFMDLCWTWARHAHYEQARQCVSRFKLALFQTIGGGWASLRRADKALGYARLLYATAASINDVATERKSRLFVGWSYLWSGRVQQAIQIFERELREAKQKGDTAQERRCVAALHHVQCSACEVFEDIKAADIFPSSCPV